MDRTELLRRSAVLVDADTTPLTDLHVRLRPPLVLVDPTWSGPAVVPYEHLPVVRDDTAASFDDALEATRQWVRPVWSVLPPSPAGGGPFRFEVQRRGATTSGGVALGATVVLTVQAAPPPGATDVVPVLPGTVQVVVAVACTNDSTGQPDTIRLPGVVEDLGGGTWRATLTPAPGVVGCLYGAFSGSPDFAATPPVVEVTWQFDGYRPEPTRGTRWPVRDLERRPWLTQRIDQQLPLRSVRGLQALELSTVLLPTVTGTSAVPTLTRTSVARTEALPFAAPCATTPEAYVETDGPDGPRVIGCVDWTQLGRLTERPWAEVPELAVAGLLRVFRSLREAGTFLVLPAAYRVSRDDDDPRVPCALWMTSSEASDELGNRALYETRLVPALDPWQWRAVAAAVEAARPGARLVLPHERMAGVDVVWRGVDGLGTAVATPLGAGFAVTLGAPLLNAPVLREALSRGAVGGAASFRLEDGSTLPSALVLDLDELAGPWPAGPVRVQVADAVATVTDLTGAGCRLLGLGVPAELPLDLPVPAGGSVDVPVPAGTSAAVPHVSLTADPAQAAELRTYLDDLHTVLSVCVAGDVWAGGAVTQVSGSVTLLGGGGAQVGFTPDSSPVLLVGLTRPLVASAQDSTFVVRLALTTSGPTGSRDLPPFDVDLRVSGVVLWLGPDRLPAP